MIDRLGLAGGEEDDENFGNPAADLDPLINRPFGAPPLEPPPPPPPPTPGNTGLSCPVPQNSPNKTPNSGDPNSWYTNPGSGQMRQYDENGAPQTDIDSDHDHGQGTPHAHNWTPNPNDPTKPGNRGEGYPVSVPNN